MAVASLLEQGGLTPSPLISAHRMNFIVLEIDPEVFEQENNSRLLRGPGYEPIDQIEWQYDGFILSLGFKQECLDCNYVGDRKEFNKDKQPPYACPKCHQKNIVRTMKTEHEEFPEFVATRAVMENRTYPNKRDPEGRVLPDKDNTQASQPLLRIVSRIDGSTRQETHAANKKPRCSLCGGEFETLTLLQRHRVQAHFKDHPVAVPKLEGMTVTKALETLTRAAQDKGQPGASAVIAPELAHEQAAAPELEPKAAPKPVEEDTVRKAQETLRKSKARQEDAAAAKPTDY
jgi:hypothetical protein